MSVSPMIVKYEKTLARNPRSQVFAPLSELYRKIGLMDKAREVLQNGIRFNPDYIPGYIELAHYYIELREFHLAHATLRPLVNSNRDNLKLQNLFVQCCTELEYKSEALDTLKYLLFLNPKNKDIAEKIKILENEEMVVADLPEEKPIQFNVDSLDSQKIEEEDYGDWVEVNTANKVEDNTDIESDWSIETINVSNEKESKETNTESPRLNHALVEIYLEQGHIEKAKEVIEKILELQPNDQETLKKLEEINSLLDQDLEERHSITDEQEIESHELSKVEQSEEENVFESKESRAESDFNTGSLMEVYDKKIAHMNQSEADIVSERLELFLTALRERGSVDNHL
jgi:tetratricopeptide (TPR) repeat protein